MDRDTILEWAASRKVEALTDDKLPDQVLLRDALGSGLPIRVAVLPERYTIWFQVEFAETIPEDRYMELSRAIAIMNAQIFVGSWNLLSSRGALYFKLSLPTKGVTYTPEGIDHLVQTVVQTTRSTVTPLLNVGLKGAPAQSVRT